MHVEIPPVCRLEGCGRTADFYGICLDHYSKLPQPTRAKLIAKDPTAINEARSFFQVSIGGHIVAATPEEEARLALHNAQDLLSSLADFEIESRDDLDLANNVLREAKKQDKILEEREKAITAPLNKALKAARELFKPARSKLQEIERLTKRAIGDFAQRQEEHNQKALQEVHAAVVANAPSEAIDASAQKIARVETVEQMNVRYTWDFEIVDEDQVPRSFLAVNETAVKAHIKKHKEEPAPVPGIRFVKKSIVSVRGV